MSKTARTNNRIEHELHSGPGSRAVVEAFAPLKNDNQGAGGVIAKRDLPDESTIEAQNEKRTRRIMAKRRSAKESRERRKLLLSQLSKDVGALSSEKRALAEANSQLLTELQDVRNSELQDMRKRQKVNDGCDSSSFTSADGACTTVEVFPKGTTGCSLREESSTIIPPSGDDQGQQLGLRLLASNRHLTLSSSERKEQTFPSLGGITMRVQALTMENQALLQANSLLRAGTKDLNEQLLMALAAAGRQYLLDRSVS